MVCLVPCLGLLRFFCDLFQSTFIESSRHVLERVVTTRSSRDESSTFCTLRHPSVLLPVVPIDFHRVESTRAGTSRDDPIESFFTARCESL